MESSKNKEAFICFYYKNANDILNVGDDMTLLKIANHLAKKASITTLQNKSVHPIQAS